MITLVSMVPLPIEEVKPQISPSRFTIPAAEPGDFNILVVEEAKYVRSLGNGEAVELPLDLDVLGNSICKDYNLSYIATNDSARPALFYLNGKLTKEEIKKNYANKLKEEEATQVNWFTRLVELADSDWARTEDPRIITTLQKIAARYLKLNKEWAKELDLSKRKFCPACQTEVSPVAVICKTCGCVIDPEAAKKMQFVKV